ncbi:DUF1187 family protein [Escherichia coli]|uniref:DUF1187 family protein n=1 Tax=Escherichia coli TaxID=562 RepID=UPI002AA29A90|nr:DUF1187 family protein [Escherichia coli]
MLYRSDGSAGNFVVRMRGDMGKRYKITATIIKPGNMPVQWLRYQDSEMTFAECENCLHLRKSPDGIFVSGWKTSGVK